LWWLCWSCTYPAEILLEPPQSRYSICDDFHSSAFKWTSSFELYCQKYSQLELQLPLDPDLLAPLFNTDSCALVSDFT
jgi:hypothetical protein